MLFYNLQWWIVDNPFGIDAANKNGNYAKSGGDKQDLTFFLNPLGKHLFWI